LRFYPPKSSEYRTTANSQNLFESKLIDSMQRLTYVQSNIWKVCLLIIIFCSVFGGACNSRQTVVEPVIKFTKIPPAKEGGADKIDTIKGNVTAAKPEQQIVLYAKGGIWWVQPFANQPFTTIQPDLQWETSTHYGTEYAALLVEPNYSPPPKLDELPEIGNGIVAISTIKGEQNSIPATLKTLNFSGYEWKIRTNTSDRGATINYFDATNVSTDENGFLHLRISKQSDKWTCAEISLTRSLGYGTYNFIVQDVSQLEPAAVFSMFTWDDLESNQNHREMDIEISQWGEMTNKNLQFVVQPYYIPANVARFNAPSGKLTYSFHWQSGSITFKIMQGTANRARVVAEHTFTSGIPIPESETLHLNLYMFGYGKNPLQKETGVIIEKFEFLP
jgi:hypothetical protein